MSHKAFHNTNLPSHLRVLKDEIEGYARGYGLDFYETIFEVVDADNLNEIAAYGGFPTRYPHWSFGMQYEELSKSYSYGLSKIYEMVINNDPCYAYLMRCNHVVDQKLVMAHVYGHCDFFKNNSYFAHTSRKMMDEVANHAARIRRYAERYGEDVVEAFVDRCMSIDDLIDIHSVAIRRRDEPIRSGLAGPEVPEATGPESQRFRSKPYMDDYINPHGEATAEEKTNKPIVVAFPEKPEKDVLQFLIEHAQLKPWQRDVLSIVRDEAYYFYPQAQTKIMNEGWACVGWSSLIPTDRGFINARELVNGSARPQVSDGASIRAVTDRRCFPNRSTVTIRTRCGFILHGSANHRIATPSGWRQLDELAVGDEAALARGTNLWATEPVVLDWSDAARKRINDICREAGVSTRTLYRHIGGRTVKSAAVLDHLLVNYRNAVEAGGATQLVRRKPVIIPKIVDERLGSFLGYLIGDGHISRVKRTIGLSTADEAQADEFIRLCRELFGLEPRKMFAENKIRVRFSSQTVQAFLLALGLKSGPWAREKTVPECILRSPAPVVSAFLRAIYDCDGYAGPQGVILSTSSTAMSEVVQLLLLNFGILSRRRVHKDDNWHVHTMGRSAAAFQEKIGFGLQRKQAKLASYLGERRWFKAESAVDTVAAIEHGVADVYDFTVEETHRYAAQGFLNHNSYWHSTMMTQKVLEPEELIDYADHHSGTMATSSGRLNPYKLGIELFRDIEHRWNTGRFGPEWENCDDEATKRNWNRPTGLGRAKIFEIRKIHNDITFIDTFLTPEFCIENKLFSFNYQEPSKNYVIESREFQKVKQRLLGSLTNFGKPWITVVNGNHRNRGELLLRHEYHGVELNRGEAKDTLTNLYFIWGRPVHLETVVDDKPILLGFDGTDHSLQPIGADHDPRRNPAPKPK